METLVAFPSKKEPEFNGEDAFKQLMEKKRDYLWACRTIAKLQARHPEWYWDWLWLSTYKSDLDKLNRVQHDLFYLRADAMEEYNDIRFQLRINGYCF